MKYKQNQTIRLSQKLIDKITNGGEKNISDEIIKKLRENTFVPGTRFGVVELDFDVNYLAPKTKKTQVHVTLNAYIDLDTYRQVHLIMKHSAEDILTPLFLGVIPNPLKCFFCRRNLVYVGKGNSIQWTYYRCPECPAKYKMGKDGKLVHYCKPKHLNTNTS